MRKNRSMRLFASPTPLVIAAFFSIGACATAADPVTTYPRLTVIPSIDHPPPDTSTPAAQRAPVDAPDAAARPSAPSPETSPAAAPAEETHEGPEALESGAEAPLESSGGAITAPPASKAPLTVQQ